jgi:alkaline phosphatase D
LVVDNVGTPANLYKASNAFLLPKGKFIQIGVMPNLGGMKMVGGNMLIPGFLGGGRSSYSMLVAKASTNALTQIGGWMKEGKVRGVVDSVFEWEDAPAAFEKLKTGRAKGKVVVRVPQEKAKEKS